MGEGQTPLRPALHLHVDDFELFFKVEGENPTGSYFDRVSTLMVSDAVAWGASSVVCASDGNHGASVSAYCALAELPCRCLVPKGTPPGKVTQILAHGAELEEIGDSVDESVAAARRMTGPGAYQASPHLNLLSVEGAKTIAFEVAEEVDQPDFVVVPLGSGLLLRSLWVGFQQAIKAGWCSWPKIPKLVGVQAKDYDPFTKAFERGEDHPLAPQRAGQVHPLADALRFQNPLQGEAVIRAIRESNGTSVSVEDAEIRNASKLLGTKEGIYAEWSSAVVLAGINRLWDAGVVEPGARVLAVVTASGFKTSGFPMRQSRPGVDVFRGFGTKFRLLRLVSEGRATFGKAMWQAMGRRPSLQAVYQHLKDLKAAGLIEEETSSDRQKRYSLTTKGQELVRRLVEIESFL
ncbi:MAG: threonine synthase [Promethearchaeota archaeon]